MATRETKKIALPAVPLGLPRNVHDFLVAVKNWVMLRNGELANSPGSRYVTKAEFDELEQRVNNLENP